jgi:hypothetical protein
MVGQDRGVKNESNNVGICEFSPAMAAILWVGNIRMDQKRQMSGRHESHSVILSHLMVLFVMKFDGPTNKRHNLQARQYDFY